MTLEMNPLLWVNALIILQKKVLKTNYLIFKTSTDHGNEVLKTNYLIFKFSTDHG